VEVVTGVTLGKETFTSDLISYCSVDMKHEKQYEPQSHEYI